MATVNRERAIGHSDVLAFKIGVVDPDEGVSGECGRVSGEGRKHEYCQGCETAKEGAWGFHKRKTLREANSIGATGISGFHKFGLRHKSPRENCAFEGTPVPSSAQTAAREVI